LFVAQEKANPLIEQLETNEISLKYLESTKDTITISLFLCEISEFATCLPGRVYVSDASAGTDMDFFRGLTSWCLIAVPSVLL
jgi:hypothetical protein